MRPATWTFLAVLIPAIVIWGWGWSRQRATASELRQKIAHQREEARELAQPLAENRRLRSLQISPTAETQLNDDVVAVARLREELKSIGRSLATNRSKAPPITKTLPPRAWVNAGSALPSTALETILWAGSRGEVDVLKEMLTFTPEAHARASALFAELPESVRAGYRSPEHWVAALTAKDIPPYGVILGSFSGGANKMTLRPAFFMDDQLISREIALEMVSTPAGWRLSVPVSAIEKYGAMLKVMSAR